MQKARILVIDDEPPFLEVLCEVLGSKGYDVSSASTAEKGLQLTEGDSFDLVLCDVKLPGMNGLEFLRELYARGSRPPFIMMTAYGGVESAVEAMKLGATDYLTKPFIFDDMVLRIQRILEHQALEQSHAALESELAERYEPRGMVGQSPALQHARELIARVAPTNSNVLILGESGTGKEVVAHAIHRASHRRVRRLVSVNCAALPEALLESELFGHTKGSFTGATEDKGGFFEVADGGTLFLDEIGAIPVSVQNKLLRAVELKEIVAVGATQAKIVDTRILAATSADLMEAVRAGTFIDALYYRLNVVEIRLPPLRERKQDIALLVDHFVRRLGQELKKPVTGVDDDALAALMAYDWPGNIRELENAIERAMILTDGDRITADALPLTLQGPSARIQPDAPFDLRSVLSHSEAEHIALVLDIAQQDKVKAAKMLGISLSSLYRKLEPTSSDEAPQDATDASESELAAGSA